MPRRLAAIALATSALAALGACGGSTATTSSSAGARSAQPRQVATSPSRGQLKAFAAAVNLRAADLPGFSVSRARGHHHESKAEKRLERELHECAGGGALEHEPSVEVGSPTFERKAGIAAEDVSSTVGLERKSADSAKLLRALHSGKLRACLSRAFKGLLEAQKIRGAHVGPVTVTFGSPPAPGTSGGYGIRVKALVLVSSLPIPFYLDILGFVDGRAQVSMFAISLPRAPSAKLEEHLYRLLLARAKAHAL